jgi:hypothetical protein
MSVEPTKPAAAAAAKPAAPALSANAQLWTKWVATQDATNNLVDFKTGQLMLNPPPAPPAPVPVDKSPYLPIGDDLWPNWAHCYREFVTTLSGDDRGKAQANLDRANTLYQDTGGIQSGMIGACYQADKVSGKWILDMARPILGTVSWPDALLWDGNTNGGTKRGIMIWCEKTREPGPNPDAVPFPFPGK